VIIPLDLTQLFRPCFTLAPGPPSSFTTDIVSCLREPCGDPAISLHSHHVSLVQWTTHLVPIMRDLGSVPRGGTYVKPGSPVSDVSLHWRHHRCHRRGTRPVNGHCHRGWTSDLFFSWPRPELRESPVDACLTPGEGQTSWVSNNPCTAPLYKLLCNC
jgi:hypothetical protein